MMSFQVNISVGHQRFANKQNQYRIRRMHELDLPTVLAFEEATWPDHSWNVMDFLKALQNFSCHCWILESTAPDYRILGYGIQYFSEITSCIANLCIHPNQRGLGLGQILLRHMINYARQNDLLKVELHVNTLNEAAFNLYSKNGFRIVKVLERYYSDTSDAYHMKLYL